MSAPWPRDAFAGAVWASKLPHVQKLVALAYADHAGDKDHAWVTYPRLQQRASLSRDAIARALTGLKEAGWLAVKDEARQRNATRYWLRIPDQQSASRPTEDVQRSVSQGANTSTSTGDGLLETLSGPSPDTSSPSPDTSSPGDGLNHSSDHSTESDQIAIPEHHRRGVAALCARFGPALTEDDALAAVASIQAWSNRRPKPIEDMADYTRRFDLEEIHSWAGKKPDKMTAAGPRFRKRPASRCDHKVVGGMRIVGSGVAASRVCGDCENASPAAIESQAAAS